MVNWAVEDTAQTEYSSNPKTYCEFRKRKVSFIAKYGKSKLAIFKALLIFKEIYFLVYINLFTKEHHKINHLVIFYTKHILKNQ